MLLNIRRVIPNRYIKTINNEMLNILHIYLINIKNKFIRCTYENLTTVNMYQIRANNKQTYEIYKESLYKTKYVTYYKKLHIVNYDVNDLQIKLDLLIAFKSLNAIDNAILFMYKSLITNGSIVGAYFANKLKSPQGV